MKHTITIDVSAVNTLVERVNYINSTVHGVTLTILEEPVTDPLANVPDWLGELAYQRSINHDVKRDLQTIKDNFDKWVKFYNTLGSSTDKFKLVDGKAAEAAEAAESEEDEIIRRLEAMESVHNKWLPKAIRAHVLGNRFHVLEEWHRQWVSDMKNSKLLVSTWQVTTEENTFEERLTSLESFIEEFLASKDKHRVANRPQYLDVTKDPDINMSVVKEGITFIGGLKFNIEIHVAEASDLYYKNSLGNYKKLHGDLIVSSVPGAFTYALPRGADGAIYEINNEV